MTDSTSKKPSASPSTSAGRPLPFELRESPIQGRGAFATRRIRKGSRIIEYTGERITQDQADERYDDEAMSRHHTFLFTLDEDTVIDAAVDGNEARFINHSCDPNCQALIEDKKIFIYALKDISPGDGARLRLRLRAGRGHGRGVRAALRVPLRCEELPGHHPGAAEAAGAGPEVEDGRQGEAGEESEADEEGVPDEEGRPRPAEDGRRRWWLPQAASGRSRRERLAARAATARAVVLLPADYQ